MEKKSPVFDEIGQISIIVDDIKTWVKRYNDEYGIGPWVVLHFTPENTREQTVRGKAEPYELYLAMCDSMNVQIELIQPVSKNTTYYEFLEKHGPGLHHMCMTSKGGFKSIMKSLEERGKTDILLSGIDSGDMYFCYVDMTDELGFIAETYDMPDNFIYPSPVWKYPE